MVFLLFSLEVEFLPLFSFIGYEKYNTIRADPALCFLERVGKPDEKAVAAEQRANDYMDGYGMFWDFKANKFEFTCCALFSS